MSGLAALALALSAVVCRPEPAPYRITGYVRGCCSPFTYDGTSVWTREHIAAASWNLPIGTRVRVAGLDFTYRVADRGLLEARHVDVLVDTVEQAYKIEEWVGGQYATVCILQP